MAEQDPEVGVVARERLETPAASAREFRPRVGAGEPHAPAAQLEQHALVEEQRRRGEVVHARPLREGIAADREVVVAEDRVAVGQPRHEAPQSRFAGRPGEQIARDHREVRLPLRDPVRRALGRACAARGHAEVEVGQVRDAYAVELRRKPRHR